MLGLDFDKARTYSVMTHVMDLSAKVRRNERLKRAVRRTLNIRSMFGLIF